MAATVIRNLVVATTDSLSQSVYLSPREIPIRESHFVLPPRVNVAQKRRLRKIGGKVAAAGCCMWERIPRGSAEHQWFGDCTFCAFVGGSLPAHVRAVQLLHQRTQIKRKNRAIVAGATPRSRVSAKHETELRPAACEGRGRLGNSPHRRPDGSKHGQWRGDPTTDGHAR